MIRRLPLLVGAVSLISSALLAVPPMPTSVPADDAYQQAFEKWKAELIDNRKQNWLTLAGLFWLKPGENSFGADASNAIVFPKGPAHAGVFVLLGNEVTAKISSEAHAMVDGKPVTTAKLAPDTAEHPSLVEMGGLRVRVIVRGQRIGIRLKDVESPAAGRYRLPVFYPIDLNYRVTAKFIRGDGKQTIDVPNVLGDVEATPVAGTAVFTINGQEVRLTDVGGSADKGLFIVFNDLTTKTETYPGGRFLDTDPVTNGTVVIDFNRAYNPPCSVTPYATCPLAPKENRLTIAVQAGEKYDRAHGHH